MIKSINRLNTVGPVKVGSLKSQLHLRPSYDELLKETLVEDENRPSIENVIDRRATRYRLNQYGSQFDNKDALDIQKKEELSRREEVKKEASVGRGIFGEIGDTFKQQMAFVDERLMEVNRQKEELEERMRLMFGQHDEMASAVSRQSIPEGVKVHSMASNQEEGEEEEPEDDPIVDEEEKKEGKDDDDDLSKVEDFIDEIRGNTPLYLANVPMEMKRIIDKIYNVGLMKDDIYIEFNNLFSELIESETNVKKQENKTKLIDFYKKHVYNKYMKEEKASSSGQTRD